MSGGNRGINMRSEREVIGLIRSLEDQGARVEGRYGTWPVKVYPPDPSKGLILFHGSVSDGNAATLKRNEIRRAGLHWPGDDGVTAKHLRKAGTPGLIPTTTTEAPMSTTTNPTTQADRKAGEHLVTPPGVLSQAKPSRSTVETFRPITEGLPPVFWTDEVMARLKAQGTKGYAKGTDTSRAQMMLDWFGFRVINTKPNRNGLSYQWALEGTERQDVSTRGLTAVPALPAEPEVVEPEAVEPALPADAGPIAAAFAEAERKRQERLATHAAAKAKAKLERDGAPVEAKVDTDEVEPVAEEAQVATITLPAPDENVGEQRDEAAEWRALIEEAEAETARVREELRAMTEDRDAERDRGNRQATLLVQRKADLDAAQAATTRAQQARDEADRLINTLREAAPAEDGWVIPWEQVGQEWTHTLVGNAAKLGVTLELRARHA